MAKKKVSVKDMVTMSVGMSLGGRKPTALLVGMHSKKVQKKNVSPW